MLDLTKIFKTKRTYLIISGVVALGAIIYVAISFSKGNLFKGATQFAFQSQTTPNVEAKAETVTGTCVLADSNKNNLLAPATGKWIVDVTPAGSYEYGTDKDGKRIQISLDSTKSFEMTYSNANSYSPVIYVISSSLPPVSLGTITCEKFTVTDVVAPNTPAETGLTGASKIGASNTFVEAGLAKTIASERIVAPNTTVETGLTGASKIGASNTFVEAGLAKTIASERTAAPNPVAETGTTAASNPVAETGTTAAPNPAAEIIMAAACRLEGSTRDCNFGKGKQTCRKETWGSCIDTVSADCTKGLTQPAECPAGYIAGKTTQTCNANGNWDSPDLSKCTSSSTPICAKNETKAADCPAGQTGTATQTCSSDGLQITKNYTNCKPKTDCTPGDENSISCGSTGGQKYTCDSAGKWQASACPVVAECSSGQSDTSKCPGGQMKTCSSAGKWTISTCPKTADDSYTAPPNSNSNSNQSTNTNQITNTNLPTAPLAPADLLEAVESITCRASTNTFAPSMGENMSLRCSLFIPNIKGKPLVTSKIYSGSFDPAKESAKMEKSLKEESTIVKSYLLNQQTPQGAISFTWDGKQNDQPVKPGEYAFVVGARPDLKHDYDYSIFPIAVTAESTKQQSTSEPSTISEQTGPASENTNQQNNQPPASEQPISEKPGAEPTPPTDTQLESSQCPGVFYPIDIVGHWAESVIKQAVDACYLTGYSDGTIKPNQTITRYEAVKLLISLVARPITGCYNNSCGSPFIDLESPTMGSYVRVANEKTISRGYGNLFKPNNPVTRSDAAAMIVRAFYPKLMPYKGCYSTNCGAGHPDNLFVDISDTWSGQYFRTLWDNGIMKGTKPFMIEPEKSVSRAEFIKMVMMAKVLK
jgi:hypothetical protein